MIQKTDWNVNIAQVSHTLYRKFGFSTNQDRDDAIQGAILKLLSLQQTSGLSLQNEEVQRWLHCVATRMLLDAKRVTTRTRCFTDLVNDKGLFNMEHPVELSFDPVVRGSEIGLDIHAALLHLSPTLRCVFELHTQGFKAEEIALMLFMTKEAVHKRIQRARREMQTFLSDYL